MIFDQTKALPIKWILCVYRPVLLIKELCIAVFLLKKTNKQTKTKPKQNKTTKLKIKANNKKNKHNINTKQNKKINKTNKKKKPLRA